MQSFVVEMLLGKEIDPLLYETEGKKECVYSNPHPYPHLPKKKQLDQ